MPSDAFYLGGTLEDFLTRGAEKPGKIDYYVKENGSTYALDTIGTPPTWGPTWAKTGLYYERSGGQSGSAGYVYDKKWNTAPFELNGHTPTGLLTGQKTYNFPDPRDGIYGNAAIFDPATKTIIKEIEIGRYTWCWGGNSKGQFILESDSFDNYYQFANPFMYDINTDKLVYMGGQFNDNWTPDIITDDGVVYGHSGLTVYSWTQNGVLKKEYVGNDVGVNMRVSNVLPNNVLFGLDGRKSNSNINGFFFLQNGEYFDLNNQVIGGLLPAGYDKWTNYCMMTPEGVIMQALQNSATGKFETHMLTPVPEPGTMIALGLGVAALARRRRQTKS